MAFQNLLPNEIFSTIKLGKKREGMREEETHCRHELGKRANKGAVVEAAQNRTKFAITGKTAIQS